MQSKVIMPQHKKGDRTTVSCLSIGDRFYKCSDGKKAVYQRIDGKCRQSTWNWHYPVRKDGAPYADMMTGKTEVIFLRNVNDTQ